MLCEVDSSWSPLSREEELDKFGWGVATCGKLVDRKDIIYLQELELMDPDALNMCCLRKDVTRDGEIGSSGIELC
jgi:hypothetical protein